MTKPILTAFTKTEISQKTLLALVSHVYSLTFLSLSASLFCATIVFIDFTLVGRTNENIYYWYGLFVIVTIMRGVLVERFNKTAFPERHIKQWANWYVIGSILAGACWGSAGFVLFPTAEASQQALIILMLAGVTAGAVPLSAAIPQAVIGFLVFATVPLIISIASIGKGTYLLFDASLVLYLVYTIFMSIKNYRSIRDLYNLRFEKDRLLLTLEEATHELEQSNKRLARAATRDPLTQIASRSLFETTLNDAIRRANQTNKLLALLYIDLDQFKPINDQHGHHTGDRLLVIVIQRLKNFFGTDSMISRIGGDEFTVILDDAKSVEEVAKVAQKVCYLLSMPIQMDEITPRVGASVGISLYPEDGRTVDALLQQADRSMYLAKERGGGSYCFASELERAEA